MLHEDQPTAQLLTPPAERSGVEFVVENAVVASAAGNIPTRSVAWVDLAAYDNGGYHPGRGLAVRLLWYFVSLALFESGWFPWSRLKRWVLRRFGAHIGCGVVIKPHVRIKYPWQLAIGDHCWIGEEAWIDNLTLVSLGNHVCVSQQAYFCTGSHDYRRRTFDLIVAPIHVGDGAWIAARATILGGVEVGPNAIVAAGSVVNRSVPAGRIVAGNPALPLARHREPPA